METDCSEKFVDAVKSMQLTKCHEIKPERDKLLSVREINFKSVFCCDCLLSNPLTISFLTDCHISNAVCTDL